eukprot:GFKZ01014758.1.p2 GENE.GFKZ01014758.1~~GFKZ01014758.1.p2  ORF type:complete len:158 (+),score=6.33 GFKZ01014758.1:2415-2888(+)
MVLMRGDRMGARDVGDGVGVIVFAKELWEADARICSADTVLYCVYSIRYVLDLAYVVVIVWGADPMRSGFSGKGRAGWLKRYKVYGDRLGFRTSPTDCGGLKFCGMEWATARWWLAVSGGFHGRHGVMRKGFCTGVVAQLPRSIMFVVFGSYFNLKA